MAQPAQRDEPAPHLDQQQTLGDSGDALTHRDCRLVVAEEEPGQHRDGEGTATSSAVLNRRQPGTRQWKREATRKLIEGVSTNSRKPTRVD